MKILSIERFGREQLLAALARTRLQGFGGARPYENAKLTVEPMGTDDLAPAQRYVLLPTVARILQLREALLESGDDIFALDGGLLVQTDEHDEKIPFIPPIVEESHEPDGRTVLIINDGIHRVFAARSAGLPISAVVINDVPPEYPYYAFALTAGWAEVHQLTQLPRTFEKKSYRDPEHYRSLFRDFNAVFPGVQKARRQSNPSHLRR